MQPFDTRYGKMLAFGNDDLISRSLRKYGEWSGLELALLTRLIPKGGVVVDAGAYIGTHSRAFSDAVGSEGLVHAFEPNPEAFDVLEKNAALAPFGNISCHPLALGERNGMVSIAPVSVCTNAGTSRVVASRGGARARPIVMSRLDRVEVGSPDFIKIDVEGMELAVVQGCEGLLAESDPVIFAECNSLEIGVRIMKWARSKRLKVRGIWSPAFNPGNFMGSSDNEFGEASEVGMLLLSTARDRQFSSVFKAERTVLLSSVDDLAMLLLKKAQYASEVLARTSVARALGSEFTSPGTVRLREMLDHAQRENTFHLARISGLEGEFARLSDAKVDAERILAQRTREATDLMDALEVTRALATSRLAEIEVLAARVVATDEALAEARSLAEERLAALAARDVALSSLETVATERLQTIEEQEKRITRTDSALEEAKAFAEERLRLLKAADDRFRSLEGIALQRLDEIHQLAAKVEKLSAQVPMIDSEPQDLPACTAEGEREDAELRAERGDDVVEHASRPDADTNQHGTGERR